MGVIVPILCLGFVEIASFAYQATDFQGLEKDWVCGRPHYRTVYLSARLCTPGNCEWTSLKEVAVLRRTCQTSESQLDSTNCEAKGKSWDGARPSCCWFPPFKVSAPTPNPLRRAGLRPPDSLHCLSAGLHRGPVQLGSSRLLGYEGSCRTLQGNAGPKVGLQRLRALSVKETCNAHFRGKKKLYTVS